MAREPFVRQFANILSDELNAAQGIPRCAELTYDVLRILRRVLPHVRTLQ